MKVIGYEYRSNNSQQKTVAKLECGHERVFDAGYRSKNGTAVCWMGCDDIGPSIPSLIILHAINHIRRAHMSRAFTLPLGDEQAISILEEVGGRL